MSRKTSGPIPEGGVIGRLPFEGWCRRQHDWMKKINNNSGWVDARQGGSTALVSFARWILWFFQAATSCGRGAASSTPPL